MTPDVLHEVVAVGVTDLLGNAVLGPYDRASFTGFRPARPLTRRFDLWRMLPKHNRRDDHTGDLLHEEKLRPTELLEKARGYASHQATYFRRCFSDGEFEFEIDNGDVERGM